AAGADGLFGTSDDSSVTLAGITYNAVSHQATIALASGFAPLVDGKYEVIVDGTDASLSLQDLAGNSLGGGADAVFTFSVDRTAPQVTLLSPQAGSITNQVISTIPLQFSEAMRDAGAAGTHSVTNPAGYALVFAGADNVFGTGDDSVVGLNSV